MGKNNETAPKWSALEWEHQVQQGDLFITNENDMKILDNYFCNRQS